MSTTPNLDRYVSRLIPNGLAAALSSRTAKEESLDSQILHEYEVLKWERSNLLAALTGLMWRFEQGEQCTPDIKEARAVLAKLERAV